MDRAKDAKLTRPHPIADPRRRLFRISSVIALLTYVAHALWASADTWSPRHETAEYLKGVLIGPFYMMVMFWFMTVPLCLIALCLRFLVRRGTYRRTADILLLWSAFAYGIWMTCLMGDLVNDS